MMPSVSGDITWVEPNDYVTPVYPDTVCGCLLPSPHRNAFGWSECLLCEFWICCRVCSSLVHSTFDCPFSQGKLYRINEPTPALTPEAPPLPAQESR